MKYSQAIVVAVAGGAALVAAAPAANRVSVAPVAPEPAVTRDLEDFFERSLDEESLLEARHHNHEPVTNTLQARDVEFDDALLAREFGSDNELSTRDMQQLDARMFEFILRIFSRPWWRHPLDHHHHHHHGHHHHHHHDGHHHHYPHHDNKDKQFAFPHGHDATHKSETHAPAALANNKQVTPEPPAGAPTTSAAAAHKEVKPVASASAAASSAATPEPSPAPDSQQTPVPAPSSAQSPLVAREGWLQRYRNQRLKDAQAEAAAAEVRAGKSPGTSTVVRSVLDEQDLAERDYNDLEARFGSKAKAAWLATFGHDSSSPSNTNPDPTVARRSYDDDLVVRDFLDALEAVKRTYAADDLDARGFDDFELDQLD